MGSAWDPKELCRLDDLVTGLVVDPKLQFVTHKMNLKYRPDKSSWRVANGILDNFQLLASDLGRTQYSITFKRLKTEVPKWWKEFENATDDLKKRVLDHIYLYLKMWDPNSGYTIRECRRYTKDGKDRRGGALFASCDYKKGEIITELKGCIAPMTKEQQREILVEGKGVNDYSVQYSMNKRKSQLWLGPAAFLNHDCKPNAKIESTGPNAASVYAISDIKCDEELLIFYGKEFFGPNNCECECQTCERRSQGKFRQSDSTDASRTSPLKVLAGCKYGLRETASRKRRIQQKRVDQEDAKVEDPKVVDIRIETEKRKRGTRIERVTQVTLRESVKDSGSSDEISDSGQPSEIRPHSQR